MKKILFLYRNAKMGYSIGRVFRPIEDELRNRAIVAHFEMPCSGYSFTSLIKNIVETRKQVRGYDVIHITGQEHYLLPFLPSKKTVVTVHDLGFMQHEHGLSGMIKALCFVHTLKFAHRVTCISEKTKQEMLHYCSIPEQKISVIPNCVNPNLQFSGKPINKDCPVILQIGNMLNKNIFRTIEALSQIRCNLRFIGKQSDEVVQELQKSQLDYSIVHDLTDRQMVEEYQKCDIVSLPSLYEGFGMPIIEGQAVGRVVVTSHLSPMKEVAGDAAVLVDPTDVQSIREGFVEAINNSENYIEKGRANVQRYEVSAIADRYFSIYSSL